MPELPEVQTIVNELKPLIIGCKIVNCNIQRESVVIGDGNSFVERVGNQTITDLYRRAKYLIFEFKGGQYLKAHLKMTGKFIVSPDPYKYQSHDRVLFKLDNGNILVFTDIRCFGKLEVIDIEEKNKLFHSLGWEPWDRELTAKNLKSRFSRTTVPIKTALLNQSIIAGIGNIYASEALFEAGISPQAPANRLTIKRLDCLIRSIRKILELALLKNGTTISDYRRVDDKTGEFQNFLRVYGKSGYECVTCGNKIIKITLNQRSTFYCPECQH